MKRMNKALVRHGTGILGLAALVLGTLALAPSLRAEDSDASQASRAVRLSNVEGEVHLSQGNQPLADQAVANTPLFEGTTINTGNDGRAEIQFEDGSVARISPQSSLTLALLRGSGTSDRDAELQLNSGLGYFELQGDNDSNRVQIRFGDTVVTAGGFTVIRISLDKAPGEVAVFSGNAHLEVGSSAALDLHGGESVALNANDPNNYNLSESIEPDSWDTWNSDRDQALTSASAGRTAATNDQPDSNNPAWSDLDANGNWYNVPDQGYVWSPNEAATQGWDPYGNGYWMSTPVLWLHLDFRISVGIPAVSVRSLELLQHLRVGLGAGRMHALVGRWGRRVCHQYRRRAAQLSLSRSTRIHTIRGRWWRDDLVRRRWSLSIAARSREISLRRLGIAAAR